MLFNGASVSIVAALGYQEKVCHINFNSIRNKLDTLCKGIKNNMDIFIIPEAKLALDFLLWPIPHRGKFVSI